MIKIGIIGAMTVEVDVLRDALADRTETRIGNFTFHQGNIGNAFVTILLSGIGKVSAAVGTTLLIEHYRPDCIINTGTAGGLGAVQVHDLVLATELKYHDVDVTAFGYEIGQQAGQPSAFVPDEYLLNTAYENCTGYNKCNIKKGLILSGDSFISNPKRVEQIIEDFPQAMAVEMESTAIAQVCHQFKIPFLVLRAISDKAGEGDAKSYEKFVANAGEISALMNISLIKVLGEKYAE